MTRTFKYRLAAVMAALLLATALVVTTSRAAFSGHTFNESNQFAAGSVSLTDNDNGAFMFNVSDMAPGTTATGCIQVTYTGSITPADVKLYIASGDLSGGSLGSYLDLVVERGTNPDGFNTCTNFATTNGVSAGGTLADFAAASTDFATGAGVWTANNTNDAEWYRFDLTLLDDPLANGESATVTFTWEAQNV
ncbi:MAG: TasA family protein [Acidimicrobiia bacterium]